MWVLGVTLVICGLIARGMFHFLLPMRGRVEMGDLAFIEATTYGVGMALILGAMRSRADRRALGYVAWVLVAAVLSVFILDSLPP